MRTPRSFLALLLAFGCQARPRGQEALESASHAAEIVAPSTETSLNPKNLRLTHAEEKDSGTSATLAWEPASSPAVREYWLVRFDPGAREFALVSRIPSSAHLFTHELARDVADYQVLAVDENESVLGASEVR